jgi:hypothetical protein
MLTIKLDSAFNSAYWHVGEPCPINYNSMDIVKEVQMDGDELDHVIDLFSLYTQTMKRPNWIPKGRVVRLFGDEAKKIVANLTNI